MTFVAGKHRRVFGYVSDLLKNLAFYLTLTQITLRKTFQRSFFNVFGEIDNEGYTSHFLNNHCDGIYIFKQKGIMVKQEKALLSFLYSP